MNMENKTMMIDFYEFTMAQTYFNKHEENKKVYFDVFFRKNPLNGGYSIMGGIDEIIEYINNFKFTDEDIEYLRGTGKFTEEFLKYLKDLKFNGDIYAVPDGTPVFPNEPVITVRANVIEAQLIETALLACFNHGALVTTAAKRIVNAAAGKPVMEFGARRARGIDAANEASKYGYIAGCCGTSNVYAAKKYGIPALGTMAHSLICDADSEYEGFLDYAKANPDNCLFLVDTYDTLRSGVPNAIKIANDYLLPNDLKLKGIRIDSGDLEYLAKQSRKKLNRAGFRDATICLSNGLTAERIEYLIAAKTPVDSFGVGDNIAACKEIMGGVYKLVAVEEGKLVIPKIKVSEDSAKTINPGPKKVYRFYDKETGYALGDVIALNNEKIAKNEYTLICPTDEWKRTTIRNYTVRELLVPIFLNGKQVYENPTAKDRRDYCAKEFNTLYPEIKRLDTPHEYYVDLSAKLLNLKKELINKYRGNVDNGHTKVKRITRNNK